ncbi:hypothetical protein CGCSCA4_v004439 [Colletotrichum siamense]|uniref:Uncharacterized protein n=1 Tax=Colletotrichum siamense TaxID=690259 RepID=A0A9P5EX17_COLSI|nr:hypothetical protein CGCSCA4_v004439 [Colletotrichum siamense]KAF4861453.1 hypothetical protein CGCSCA2_v004205 [Colletotrichum siamense]
MAYEDPDKFISDSTLFFLPGAMILWLLIFMIVTLSYSVNSPPKIMPRAVNLGLVGVASVFMGLWLLGLMVCYCRGTFLKGRSGRDVAPKAPGWGEDMEKRMCQLEKQTKPPTPLPGQAQRDHQNAQIEQRNERLLSQPQPFQGQPMPQPVHPQNVQPFYPQQPPTQQPLAQQQPYPHPPQPEPIHRYHAYRPNVQQQIQQQAHQDSISQPPTVSRPFKPIPTSNERLQFQYPEHPGYDVSSSSLIKPASEGPVDCTGSLREPWLADERKSESPTGFRQFETESQFASSWRGFAEWKTLGPCPGSNQAICTE